ncbi:MAG: glycoside hydrolase family 88/105 protein [Bacteroidota bacterium]
MQNFPSSKILVLLFIIAWITSCDLFTNEPVERVQVNTTQKEVEQIVHEVYKWQIENHPKEKWYNYWMDATFFHGVTEIAKAFDKEEYWIAAEEWADFFNWEIDLTPERLDANQQITGAIYLNLYEQFGKAYMIEDTEYAIDSMFTDPGGPYHDNRLWWWADALYMAPVPIAKLGELKGEDRYFNLINRYYWETYDRLYDHDYHLFFRDFNYLNKRDDLGNPIFWSRGNGWVIGGLITILNTYPHRDKTYHKYLTLFKSMMNRLVTLQGDDGLWRTNLLSPEIYSNPETSGSAFFCYGLAWGVNEGILEETRYFNAVIKAWEGLLDHINKDGKLGSAQAPARKPTEVDPENSELYATGAFLLAGKEIHRVVKNNSEK